MAKTKYKNLNEIMSMSTEDLLRSVDTLAQKGKKQWMFKKCLFRNKYKLVMVNDPFGMSIKNAICFIVARQQGYIWNKKSPLAQEEIEYIATMDTKEYLVNIKNISDRDVRRVLQCQEKNLRKGSR